MIININVFIIEETLCLQIEKLLIIEDKYIEVHTDIFN